MIDVSLNDTCHCLLLQPVCENLAYGDLVTSVPRRPSFPSDAGYQQALSVTKGPVWASPREWFIFASVEELM